MNQAACRCYFFPFPSIFVCQFGSSMFFCLFGYIFDLIEKANTCTHCILKLQIFHVYTCKCFVNCWDSNAAENETMHVFVLNSENLCARKYIFLIFAPLKWIRFIHLSIFPCICEGSCFFLFNILNMISFFLIYDISQ